MWFWRRGFVISKSVGGMSERVVVTANVGEGSADHPAWDVLPPIWSFPSQASQPKECRLQYSMTLQHMGTCGISCDVISSLSTTPTTTTTGSDLPSITSCSTNPIFITTEIMNTKLSSSYMIVGCHDGTIAVWNLHQLPALQQPDTPPIRPDDDSKAPKSSHSTTTSIDPIHALDTWSPIPPCCTLDTTKYIGRDRSHTTNSTTNSTIVQLFPVSQRQRTLVAVTIVGMIYVVQITIPSTPDTTTLEVQNMWSTGRIQPTCLGCLNGNDDDEHVRIVIGYASGHLECWSVTWSTDSHHHDDDDDDDVNVELSTESSRLYPTPRLQWRGHWTHDYCRPPPRIVGLVPLLQKPPPPSAAVPHECLVVTLQHDERPTTSAMVEVIDVTTIIKCWNDPPNSEAANEDNVDRSLPLEDFIVLPEPGREISDLLPSHQPHSSPKTTVHQHWIPSRGTNCLLSTTVASPDGFDDTNVIAVGHADGMITILDVSSIDSSTMTPAWGVSSSHGRYCSLYPCIGMGRLDLYDPTNQSLQPYLVGCLRGAATYLIPLQSAARHGNDPLLALTVPHDTEDDVSSLRYTQGFVTGHIPASPRCKDDETISRSSSNSGSIPLLAYVWPGGVIDVYRCGLSPHESATTEDLLLQQLIANGSVDAYRAWILSSHQENTDGGTMNSNWTNALQEIRRHGETTPITFNDIISDTFTSLRTELLNLNQ